MTDCGRRRFLVAGVAACAGALTPLRTVALADPPATGGIDVGPRGNFDRDGAVSTFAGRHHFFVVRQGDKLFALSSICTHERESLVAQNDRDRLYCPEHKAVFSLDGRVQKGKPKKSLARLGIRLDGRGHVFVDPAVRFEEDHWNDAGASVALQ